MTRHIHLATKDGLKRFQAIFFAILIDANAIVMKFLDAKHIAMIRDGHALHAVGNSLVHQVLDLRLSVKNRIVCMNV